MCIFGKITEKSFGEKRHLKNSEKKKIQKKVVNPALNLFKGPHGGPWTPLWEPLLYIVTGMWVLPRTATTLSFQFVCSFGKFATLSVIVNRKWELVMELSSTDCAAVQAYRWYCTGDIQLWFGVDEIPHLQTLVQFIHFQRENTTLCCSNQPCVWLVYTEMEHVIVHLRKHVVHVCFWLNGV